jgi:hypothetical protein
MKRSVLFALAGAWNAAAQIAGSKKGVAGEVPRGYTEVCAVRGDLPSGARRENDQNPSPFVKLFYGGREYETPTQDDTLAPVWQGSGCNTFLTPEATEGGTLSLRLEMWDDRTRAYDPLSVVFKDEIIASGETAADQDAKLWLTLEGADVQGARLYVSVTVSPVKEDGTVDADPDRFRSLTSTPAFFVYVGVATFTIIVCVCCVWGKGTAPPAMAIPLVQPRKSEISKSSSSLRVTREPSVAVSASTSRPSLTVEVSTPPVVRDMAVIAIEEKPPPEPKAADGDGAAPSNWASMFRASGTSASTTSKAPAQPQ